MKVITLLKSIPNAQTYNTFANVPADTEEQCKALLKMEVDSKNTIIEFEAKRIYLIVKEA